MSGFKDYFSHQSAAYSRHRPGYPEALIEYVVGFAPDRSVAIDCATGNGQAATQLADSFDLVLGIDGSHAQLAQARPHPGVRYAAAIAESLPVRTGSAALIVAAQAAHWFDFDRFYPECRRTLRPGGVVAAWTYEKFRVDAQVDAIVDDFYVNEVGRYWPPERLFVDQGYQTLPFPPAELPTRQFELVTEWTLEQVMGYLATWSSVQRYKDDRHEDPLPALRLKLASIWADGSERRLVWPIHLRLGRV